MKPRGACEDGICDDHSGSSRAKEGVCFLCCNNGIESFPNSLRSASEIQMKIFADEMHTISKGLEIAKQESSNAKRDTINFWKVNQSG
ncbi:hypothetical protein Tco_0767158 [Tanacetum coccineum]